jgi:hypothetical protein
MELPEDVPPSDITKHYTVHTMPLSYAYYRVHFWFHHLTLNLITSRRNISSDIMEIYYVRMCADLNIQKDFKVPTANSSSDISTSSTQKTLC